MRKSLIVVLTALVIVGAFAPAVSGDAGAAAQADATCEYPVPLTDATGEEITLEEPPERIVALQPSDAQTVFEIGAEENLVGMPINEYTDHHDAGDRTDVAVEGEQEVNVEAIIDLEPDVVLAANVTLEGDIQQLRDAGLTVYHFETASSLDDVRENVRLTGQLTGACDGADERIDWMDERLEAIETALEDEERPLAYWSIGGGWTAGTNTFQHEILTTAGVENVAERAEIEGWAEMSEEVLVEEDPEWIIYGADGHGADDEGPALSEGAMETTAYEEDNLVAVDSNAVNQPAPHVVHAIETIVEAVHPDAYEEAQAALEESEDDSDADEGNSTADDESADETNESADEADNESDDEETAQIEDEEDSIPGFGVPVAVAALLAVLGVASRRR